MTAQIQRPPAAIVTTYTRSMKLEAAARATSSCSCSTKFHTESYNEACKCKLTSVSDLHTQGVANGGDDKMAGDTGWGNVGDAGGGGLLSW